MQAVSYRWTLQATPDNVALLGEDLDHPESVFVDPDGVVYCGGEAGQVYCLAPDGTQQQIGSTFGNILGLVVDGRGNVHCCDYKRAAVFRVDPRGTVTRRSSGIRERRFSLPNHPVFDAQGNLFVSDSGNYWKATGVIYLIRPDDTTELFHSGPFHYPNGIAIDPSDKWLYVAQSAAWNIVRIPLDGLDKACEEIFRLPDHTVPDGMWFAADGRLFVGCYRPDQIICCHPNGSVEVVIRDPTAELLIAPTNAFPHAGRLYIANLGGRHISIVTLQVERGKVHMPTNVSA
jgi:gluconolactonase